MSARRVLVTGASSGIGRSLAERFSENGDDVVAVARNVDRLRELAATRSVVAEPCDVTDEGQVQRLFERTGTVDVLVCSAGAADAAPLVRTSLATWQRLFDVNATGVFLLIRQALPAMVERGHGRVIVIASTAARVGAPYTAAYTASKHAAVGLVRAAASEVAGTDISVNAVCPTFVDTPMTDASVEKIMAATGRNEEESRAALARQSPLGRLLRPDEVADATLWLASSAAGAVNGQTIVLDGGGLQA